MKLPWPRRPPRDPIPRLSPAPNPAAPCETPGHYPTWPIAHRAARLDAVIKARRYTVTRHTDRCWTAAPANTPRTNP